MNYGLYLSAAGTLTNLHKQDVYANNLANVNTAGFKPDQVYTKHRLPERLESPTALADPQWLLEQLGGGQFVDPTRTSFTQGPLEVTGNPLDAAIEGEGFFVVRSGPGAAAENLRFTRDGRFTLNERGELVMASTGMRVLDTDNAPIRLNGRDNVRIETTGEVFKGEQLVARLQITRPQDLQALRKTGQNLLRFREDAPNTQRIAANGRVMQRHVEGSAVDPILAMNAMIGASNSAQGNATLMQYHDHIMGQAINTFGRVA